MLFGRLRVPVERASTPEAQERTKSGLHAIPSIRGGSPQRPLSLVPAAPLAPLDAGVDDEFWGLDRLDREELDEE